MGQIQFDLDVLERHPIRHFFHESRQTEGAVNTLLSAWGAMAVVAAAAGALPWFFVVVGLLLLWQVVRNYRRYVERVHFAIAERDRAGIEPPTHPDHR
jgi:hypothetical protein